MPLVTSKTKKAHDEKFMQKQSGKKDNRSNEAKEFDSLMTKAKNSQRVSKALEQEKQSDKSESSKVHMGDWMKKYKSNEDRNYHSENLIRLANLTGNVPHHEEAMDIYERHMDRGYMDEKDSKKGAEIHKTNWPMAEKMHKDWQSENQ
jgi:hypothetical protein